MLTLSEASTYTFMNTPHQSFKPKCELYYQKDKGLHSPMNNVLEKETLILSASIFVNMPWTKTKMTLMSTLAFPSVNFLSAV